MVDYRKNFEKVLDLENQENEIDKIQVFHDHTKCINIVLVLNKNHNMIDIIKKLENHDVIVADGCFVFCNIFDRELFCNIQYSGFDDQLPDNFYKTCLFDNPYSYQILTEVDALINKINLLK